MTPPTVMAELARLFPLDDHDPPGHSLEDAVLDMLADHAGASCLVCDGALERVPGGVRCVGCGSELLLGVEPAPAWVA
jgi:hypothetical protein